MKIDKNVPIPKIDGRTGREPKYPFGEMEVGDSFWVPDEAALNKAGSRVQQAASQYAKRHPGWRYATRQEDDGRRVWRTA